MIDPHSVVICAGASVAIALVLGVLMGRERGDDAGATWLICGNVSYLAAVCALLMRPLLGFELSAFLVISGAYVGLCLSYCAVLTMEAVKPPLRLLSAIGLVCLPAQGAMAGYVESATPLMASSSIVSGALSVWMTISVWRLLNARGGRIALLVALPFGAIAFGYITRLVAILVDPGGAAPLMATILIITIMSWSAIILELGMLASVERWANARLTDALKQAEEHKRAREREQFLLSISHELRTPLNGVLGLSALMQAQAVGPLPDRYAAFADGIHRSGVRLLDLVTNLLDILAPEDAARQSTLTDVELSKVLAEVEEGLSPLAGQRGVKLSWFSPEGGCARVRADQRRLVRMLTHLGDNAVKYARSRVVIRCVRDDSDDWLITVSDDGPGLAVGDVEEAMKLFGRVGGVDDPNAGAGVGLTLASAIAKVHGGALSFEKSEAGGLLVGMKLRAAESGRSASVGQGPRLQTALRAGGPPTTVATETNALTG